jgi:hypothetical protein
MCLESVGTRQQAGFDRVFNCELCWDAEVEAGGRQEGLNQRGLACSFIVADLSPDEVFPSGFT